MKNKQAILLLSGGIDSTTLLAKLATEGLDVIALSFNYGQKHCVELEFAKINAQKYGVKHHRIINLDNCFFDSSALINQEIDVSTYKSQILPTGKVNAYIPYRNLVFTSIALSFAENIGVEEIYLAFNKDDSKNFWDCKNDFIDYLNRISNLNNAIKVKTPFIDLTKKEVIALAKKLNVSIESTITCYQPNGTTECGYCLSCVTKKLALKELSGL